MNAMYLGEHPAISPISKLKIAAIIVLLLIANPTSGDLHIFSGSCQDGSTFEYVSESPDFMEIRLTTK